ncbi:hypothetical protein L2E82_11704 [Cichorium intybus]|uniref:Uncharacterized protein n=1 Tax=Cichorium intybus TaxID=13427 RepID=A0ACB9GF62_CICIN|nr:hypothetical protein L2E82_11704 [Cichorium intybus]
MDNHQIRFGQPTNYQIKKKLLEVKGFDPNGNLKIKNTCSIDLVNSVLEDMLQRARIIHSDEVDFCFGGIDGSQRNLDKEKCLLQWGENNGVKSIFDIAYIEGAEREAIAREDLEVGDIPLEIPVSAIILEDLIYDTNMFAVLKKVEGISSKTMLLLWSMKEKYDTNSKFKVYFDTLPEAFNTVWNSIQGMEDQPAAILKNNTTRPTREFKDVKLLNDLLMEKNKETGWETPIPVDAASGGFVAPFIYPNLEWDFKLSLVKTINVSGHKYGLVYAGVGG